MIKPKLNDPDVEPTTTTIYSDTVKNITHPYIEPNDICITNVHIRTHNPTIEQVKQEWEEKGWQIDILKQFPIIKIWRQNDNERFIDEIIFYLKTLTYKIDFEADYEINNRIGKTLKALEVENDKQRSIRIYY